jgi:hypothetical protein
MLNPQEPDEGLKALLADPVYSDRVTYVKGSAISFKSFMKTKLKSARAAFILSSRTNSLDITDVESDATTVMRALSMRKFNPRLPIFAQVILPRSKTHVNGLANHVLCIDEFKLGMMVDYDNCRPKIFWHPDFPL